MTKRTFPVTGMSCASCAISVESMLAKQKAIAKASVNFADNSALIEYDEDANLNDFKKAVQSIGYDLDIVEHKTSEEVDALREKAFQQLKLTTVLAFVFALPVFVLGMFFHHYETGKWISMGLSAIVVFGLGRQFFVHAYKQATHFKANMDTLVALSTGVSFAFSAFNTYLPQVLMNQGLKPDVYFESAAMITAFILLGRWMEENAKSNTSTAIKHLIGLQPNTVRVLRDELEQEIKLEEVVKEEVIIIRPGEKIPVDGLVTEGNTYIDESMITGESMPMEKVLQSKVFAGTINQKGSITITASKVGKETLLAQIIKTVQEAQGSKAPVQRLVDKIAGVFVPVVMVIALLTFVLWITIGGKAHLAQAFISAVSVLVIACPCALGLATPTAIMVGVGRGAEKGILIRNAEAIESAKDIDVIVLDKTGTITKGKPEVTDMLWLKTAAAAQLAPILSAMELRSEHPLAGAVVKHLAIKTEKAVLEKFMSLTGKGVQATVASVNYWVGSERLMKEKLIWILPETEQQIKTFKEKGKTVIFFSTDNELLAVIALADALKETSVEAIRELMKTQEVVMLTGDNEATAKAIAQQVGIIRYKAEVLPADKAKFIAEEKAKGKKVAMVGDGINDSEALALADLSMAMGSGTDIAMNVADITLMHSDLNSIPKAIGLSKRIVATIKQNLFWAFVYNIIGIPIAAGVLYPFTGFQLDPMIASVAMALSSVSVVSNSLLLKRKKI